MFIDKWVVLQSRRSLQREEEDMEIYFLWELWRRVLRERYKNYYGHSYIQETVKYSAVGCHLMLTENANFVTDDPRSDL